MGKSIFQIILFHGADILNSDGMLSERKYIQHGNVSCYEHSIGVAEKSIEIAQFFSIPIDERSLVRGALLHDYFLYDWHRHEHRLHGFFHAKRAFMNAKSDFNLNKIEIDIIKRHMFPLNICPPIYRESWIVCMADKICAFEETVNNRKFSFIKRFLSFHI